MKNKKSIIIIILASLFLTTGCGQSNYIKDEYKVTGQKNMQNNILCAPEKGTELEEFYLKHDKELKVSMKKLPTCNKFKITSNKSSGLWEFLFVKPLAWLILKIGYLIGNMGVSLILVGLLIRIVLLPFAYKTQKNSKNMGKVQAEMQKIENKYKGRDDQQSQLMKSQEMMSVYKKNGVSPTSGCLIAFIQLPVFFAFLQAINRVPAIFEDTMLGFNLGMTPYMGLQNGNYWYLLFVALIAVSTYFSFNYSMKQTASMTPGNNNSQMSMMSNIMTIMIIITSFSMSTALGMYWIVTYAFIAIQTYLFKVIMNKDNKKDKKTKKDKNIKEKLDVKRGLKYGKNN